MKNSIKTFGNLCVGGAISERLKQYGFNVTSSDIVNYGYKDTVIQDLLECKEKFKGDIISNPPYNQSIEMTLKSLELTNRKVAFLMKIQFLETVKRHQKIFSKYPPSNIYVFTKRIQCYKNGVYETGGSAVCYCWVVWDKNNNEQTKFNWIPNYRKLYPKYN